MHFPKRLLGFFVLTLTLLLGAQIHAAEKDKKAQADAEMQAMMAKAKEAGTPGAGHEVLKSFEGEWTVTSKSWMKPGDKPQQSTGTSSFSWVLGGRFLKQDFKGNWGGEDFTGLGYVGFDNVKKEYVSTWMDSMSTGIGQAKGQYDAATKTITDQGSFSCPIKGTVDFRSEWKILDKDKFSFSMYMPDPNGKEFRSMEMLYKRAK
ncbi:DUF1579 domain-containing protein [bacterium]|nr:MAG: DUF1579 domain-containing protein [bacterium]